MVYVRWQATEELSRLVLSDPQADEESKSKAQSFLVELERNRKLREELGPVGIARAFGRARADILGPDYQDPDADY